MKIAIATDAIYPFTLGGSETRNHEIARRLAERGHQVHILGAKLWKGKNEIEIDGIKITGLLKYQRLYTKKGKRSLLPPLFLSARIFFHLLKNDYDIIDVAAFNFLGCFACKLASLIKKTPLVVTWHQYFGDYLIGYFGPFLGRVAMILEKISTKLSKNNIAVSNFIKSELIKREAEEKNIKVISNGADIGLISRIPSQAKKYDLLFAGRLNYQKNLPLLVEAVKILKKNLPEIKIAVVGRGEEKEKIEKLIKNYHLENNFIFLGEIKDKKELFKLFKSCEIFVLPSILEGFPLTMIEANACGLPVVSVKSRHNNPSEYIKNTQNGATVEPDPRKIAKTIENMLKNPALMKKMSGSSIKRAAEYSWDVLAAAQENYYKKIQFI